MSITNTNTNSNVSNVSNVNNGVVSPSMQDLVTLLQEQSKVIGGLQRTIKSLNEVIRNLNDKIQMLEAPASASASATEHVVGSVVSVAALEEVSEININVTTGSKNVLINPLKFFFFFFFISISVTLYISLLFVFAISQGAYHRLAVV